jgi:hypothetical protein
MPDPKMLQSVGLCIGLPFCGRPISPEWAVSFSGQSYPLNIRRFVCSLKGEEVGKARNQIAEDAVSKGAKYLWFLDDDTAPPFHAIRSLINTLENADSKTMVAGGIYCAKAWPTEPIVYRGNGGGAFWKWKSGDIFECSGLGTGCMVIKTEVFKHLPKPWFQTIDEDGTPEVPIVQVTDDLYFCEKVINAGFKILADTHVLCVHWGWDEEKKQFVPYMLPDDSYPIRPVSEDEPRCARKFEETASETVEETECLQPQ